MFKGIRIPIVRLRYGTRQRGLWEVHCMPTQVVHLSPGIIAHSSSLCVRCRVSEQVALDVRLSECRCDMLSTSRTGRNVRAVICCVCVCVYALGVHQIGIFNVLGYYVGAFK